MRLISEKAAEKLVSIEMAIEAAIEAFSSYSDGTANVPLRAEIHWKDPNGIALIMPGMVGDALGLKFGSSVETMSDRAKRHTTVFIAIWDPITLEPRGLISADGLNNHRTAAGFAAATQALSRGESATHVLFGAGKIAFASALYISAVRPIRRLIICSRNLANRELLAARIRQDSRFGNLEVLIDVPNAEAVRQADIITTVTRSDDPVFDGTQLPEGVHINLGGANKRHQREMDDAAAKSADFWLDSDTGCRARSGDLMTPLETGVISPDQIKGEIGALFLGKIEGRKSNSQRTVFKSLGIAAQDLVLGSRILALAQKQGVGLDFDHLADVSGICEAIPGAGS